jgi:hypothetical protein
MFSKTNYPVGSNLFRDQNYAKFIGRKVSEKE